MALIKNSLNEAVLHFTSNATIVVAGNNSVSNVAITGQTVASATIRKIAAASNSSSTWTIKRGANTVWVTSGNFLWDLQAHQMPLTQDATANLVVELTGGPGSLIIDIGKESAY